MALTEQLAPPPGFELVHAVGTTFTLDLETALGVPLSFASQRITAADGELGIFEALRRATEKVDIFAQAGALSAGTQSKLVAYLELMVHPVNHAGGLFHPKVWFLEYGREDERAYRFLCASRNLTSDRSWDVLVRLDGEVPRGRQFRSTRQKNAPLVMLLRALPELAVHPLEQDRRARLDALAERISGVTWENPSGLELLNFHVFGLQMPAKPNLEGSHALVISPFVSKQQLANLLAGISGNTVLLSRPETLDQLDPSCFDGRISTKVLDEMAVEDAVHDEGVERLVGLHAKVVILDYFHGSRIFVGSSNATVPGWSTNVEVMIELKGSRNAVGSVAVLDAMGELVEDYPTAGGEPADPSEDVRWMLDELLMDLAGLRLTVEVAGPGPYNLRVRSDDPVPSSREAGKSVVVVRWRPLGHNAEYDVSELADEMGAEVMHVPLVDVTPFIEFIARHPDGTTRRTLALAQLKGDPQERRQAIIAEQLTDRKAFVHLLSLMLELASYGSGGDWLFERSGQFTAGNGDPGQGIGLFEALLRAVAVGHEGLEEVRSLVDYLSRHMAEDSVIPDGFDSLWSAVWSAHKLSNGDQA